MNNLSGSFLVGYDFSNADTGVLVIGINDKRENVKVINTFSGKDAKELFDRLTTDTLKKENKSGKT